MKKQKQPKCSTKGLVTWNDVHATLFILGVICLFGYISNEMFKIYKNSLLLRYCRMSSDNLDYYYACPSNVERFLK